MCGICGIVAKHQAFPIAMSVLSAMRDALAHRGPDDAGHYLTPGVGLGSRRLAIVDLSERGHMPMGTRDGRFWITYNGEVYNYRQLRATLEKQGYSFLSNTDTEVLLYLFIAEGPAMLDQLNGMFAIAIWDNDERRLFLARDRLGIKPLYYTDYEDKLYFASEEKALFAAGVPREFDHQTWGELLSFRYVAGECTPFTHVHRLLPGHYLIWQNGKKQIHRWWSLTEKAIALRENLPADPICWFRETFDDAVKIRRISDVPVGVLLSGGLDSSSVSASLAQQVAGAASFTVRFSETGYDEGPLARQVVSRCKLDGHEIFVRPEDLLTQLRHAAWLNDEPLVHRNDLHLLTISQYAKSRVTVLLSGEGADETLGGYVRYLPLLYPGLFSPVRLVLPRLQRTFNLNGRWAKLSSFVELNSRDKFVLFNSCEVLPGELQKIGYSPLYKFTFREQVLAEAKMLYPDDLVRQAMYSDQHTFLCSILDRNDRMTMGASIECRVPFLDFRLVEMLAALPTQLLLGWLKGKLLLRHALGSRLPPDILKHRKWGFGVPWHKYLRQFDGFRYLLLNLPNAQLILDSPLERRAIGAQVRAFLKGDDRPFALLFQIMMVVVAWDVGKMSQGFIDDRLEDISLTGQGEGRCQKSSD